MTEEAVPEAVEWMRRRRDEVRADMGGASKVAAMHERGERTIRDHIDGLVDRDSFVEVGTFARSMNPDDKDNTPGDGKIGGHAKLDGRPITVWGDDITVKRGSSSKVASRKLERLVEAAFRAA